MENVEAVEALYKDHFYPFLQYVQGYLHVAIRAAIDDVQNPGFDPQMATEQFVAFNCDTLILLQILSLQAQNIDIENII